MKINLKQVLVNFKNESLKNEKGEELTIGEALSNVMILAKEGGKMKLFVLAEKFYKEKEIDLDASDLNLVKKAVQASEGYSILVTGQLEKILEELK